MTIEILMSCMHQSDASLVNKSGITGDVTVINQCDGDAFSKVPTKSGTAKIYSTTERGLTKSRNMAIEKSSADICMLCDDDEVFEPDYEEKILSAYGKLPDADVIIFKMKNRTPSFEDRVFRLKFPQTMKVSSWQISFRRQSLLDTGVRFDELLGAGSGNGAEEELKFLLDCERKGLKIYYVPEIIASVSQTESTWFSGFSKEFFENRGATTRYILGFPLAVIYGLYYVIKKREMFAQSISPSKAFFSTMKGILENKISKQKKQK